MSRIDDLFIEAIKLSGSARVRFLEAMTDEERQQVKELLASDCAIERRGGKFLNPICRSESAPDETHQALEDPDKHTIGPEEHSPARFEIIREHDKGSLGVVFVARDNELQRDVALKQMSEKEAAKAESRERFITEAEVTGCLEHPGIVPVYSLGEYGDGRPFYAMRFIRGRNLKRAIESFYAEEHSSTTSRNLELRRLLTHYVDVCHAVDYAHSRGVVHRDLKPANIMLGDHGETLVVDWGLAGVVGRAATDRLDEAADGTVPVSDQGLDDGTLVGSPAYMPPEQAEGLVSTIDARSDIYSLGAILFHVLTGQPPFKGGLLKVLASVRTGDFPKPSTVCRSVPDALENVCLKAMAVAPAERYATPREIADAIEHWMADEPIFPLRSQIIALTKDADSHPGEPEYRFREARERCNLSIVLAAMQRVDDALDEARKSCSLLSSLRSKTAQQDIRFKHELIICRQQEIRTLESMGRPAEAERLKQQNREELRQLVRQHGQHVDSHDAILSMTLHSGEDMAEMRALLANETDRGAIEPSLDAALDLSDELLANLLSSLDDSDQHRLAELLPARSDKVPESTQKRLSRVRKPRTHISYEEAEDDRILNDLLESALKKIEPDTRVPQNSVLDELFIKALRFSEPERAEFLASLTDQERDRVEALLRADAEIDQASDTLNETSELPHRYRVIEPIATGGSASIFKVLDTRLSRVVAVKVAKDAYLNRHVDHESAVVSKLVHPNIPTVFDLGKTQSGCSYVSMPLYPTQTLSDRIRSDAELREMLRAFVSVCSAIEFAHGFGVLHLDPKPANVVFLDSDHPILLDWGLAYSFATGVPDRSDNADSPMRLSNENLLRTDQSLTRGLRIEKGTPVGTIPYMSPEQARGDTETFNRTTDVYLLGGTLYSILNGGKYPNGELRKTSFDQMFQQIVSGAATSDLSETLRMRSVPKRLRAICMKALALEQSDRYQRASDLAYEVDEWLGGKNRWFS